MKQIQIERPKRRRADIEFLPLDPRDPDIVRAKALVTPPSSPADGCEGVLED
jgi:hypothetical protein